MLPKKFLFIFFIFLVIPLVSASYEYEEFDYKVAVLNDFGDINLTSLKNWHCIWDDPNNEWKKCSVVVEIDNNWQSTSINKNQLLKQINVDSQNEEWYSSTDYNTFIKYFPYIYEVDSVDECQIHDECNHNNYSGYCKKVGEEEYGNCTYLFEDFDWYEAREFSSWDVIKTKLTIPLGVSAVRLDFEVPIYANTHFNVSLGNFTLDPEIDACAELNSANEVYTLNQSVQSDDTCMNISAENVTLDCDGFDI
ncbi:MAG: hypothetical protein JSW08_00460, partial [archaeon]